MLASSAALPSSTRGDWLQVGQGGISGLPLAPGNQVVEVLLTEPHMLAEPGVTDPPGLHLGLQPLPGHAEPGCRLIVVPQGFLHVAAPCQPGCPTRSYEQPRAAGVTHRVRPCSL